MEHSHFDSALAFKSARGGQSWRRRALTGLAALALALVGGGAAQAADTIKVAVNFTTGAAYPFFIGQEKGFFAAEGIDLNLMNITNQVTTNAALAAGDIDISVTYPSAGFFNIAANGDFVMLAGEELNKPGYSAGDLVVSTAAYDKGFKTAADLPGKRLAIANFGGATDYNLFLYGQKYKFARNTITIVQVGNDGNAAAAVAGGSVDAALNNSPALAVQLEQQGKGKIISWTGDEFTSLSNMIYATRKIVGSRREDVVKFMRAYLKAAAVYDQTFQHRDANGKFAMTPEATDMLNLFAKQSGSTVDAIIPTLPYVVPGADLDPTQITDTLKVWQDEGQVKGDFSKVMLTDTSIVADAKK